MTFKNPPLVKRTEILISGFGGQGVVRMGQIIGLCAIHQGQKVTMLKSHGTETRGGYVRAQIVISPSYVDSPVVENADVFVAFSGPAYKKFFDLARGMIVYDPEMVKEIRNDGPDRHLAVPATALSKERFNNALFANMIMLGALTRVAGMDIEAMRQAMLEVIRRFHEQNLKALQLGYNLGCAVSAVRKASDVHNIDDGQVNGM
ncbi:MAG: 2-oxoacid:acceptor oxidoreductase family protein [Candidatus Binatia bacterium]